MFWVGGIDMRYMEGGTLFLQMRNHLTAVWRVAVLEQVNALPCAQCQMPVCDRNRQADRHHRGFDVGGHVVWPLVGVGQVGHACVGCWWHQTVEEVLQVCLHLGVGVFLD